MGRAKSAAFSAVVSFVIGFTVASLLDDASTGVRAGAVSALIGAVAAFALAGGDVEDLEELEELADDLEAEATSD
jgi:hypothetical protein